MFVWLRAGVRLCGQPVNSCYQGSLGLQEWRKSPCASASSLCPPADVSTVAGSQLNSFKKPESL